MPLRRHLLERLARPVEPFTDQQQRLGASATAHVFLHLVANPRQRCGIVEPLQQRRGAAIHSPARQQRGIEARSRCQPGILVGRHILPGGARGVDHVDHRLGLALHIDAKRLDMGEVHRHVGFAPDGDGFLHRFKQTDAVARFVALVGVVKATAPCRLAGNSNNFRRLGKALRRVEQPGGESAGPLAHAPGDQRLHPVQFGSIGRPGILTQHLLADSAETHERNDVGADARCNELLRISPDIWRAGAINTNDDTGHPLVEPGGVDPRCRIRRAEEAVGMGVRIDEPRRDDLAARIDRLFGNHVRPLADIDNLIAGNRDIADIGRSRAAIINGAIVDQHVDTLWRGSGGSQHGREGTEAGYGQRQRDDRRF